jgi:hypothetical protein
VNTPLSDRHDPTRGGLLLARRMRATISNLRSSVQKYALLPFLSDVPIESLIYRARDWTLAEGFGGKSLRCWPVSDFYRLYHRGRRDRARQEYEAWYYELFVKYGFGCRDGDGLQTRSIYRAIEALHRQNLRPFRSGADGAIFDQTLVKTAIASRVDAWLMLFESIHREGYHWRRGKLIRLTRTRDGLMLGEGHHRAASLLVLGAPILPRVWIRRHRSSEDRQI